MFEIERLQEKDVKDFMLFTYPYLRENLEACCSRKDKLVLAAFCDSKPAGLIMVRIFPKENMGKIQSVYVVSEYRGQGLGTHLLQAVVKELCGCTKLHIYFPIEEGRTSPLLSILQKEGWSDPVKNDEVSKFNISSYSWIYEISLRGSDVAIRWEDITPEQLQYVKDGEGKWYSLGVSPFQPQLKEYHPDTSFWLARNGKIIGWLVTVPVAKDTLSYERLYICERFQQTGVGIKLLAHTFKTQISKDIPYGATMINYDEKFVNASLLRFYEKRIKPFTIRCKGYYISEKTL
jgi:GNAT superfamily N-acetyltransferase